MFLFEKWFVELALPRLKRSPGKKLIIRDNLASHISPNVIKLFAPLKKSWLSPPSRRRIPRRWGSPSASSPPS
jgi:hypothetical protein